MVLKRNLYYGRFFKWRFTEPMLFSPREARLSRLEPGGDLPIRDRIVKKVKNEIEKSVTVSGIIIPADWDKAGNAIGFVLSTFDDKEYRIILTDSPRRVRSFAGKRVRLRGVVINAEPLDVIYVKNVECL